MNGGVVLHIQIDRVLVVQISVHSSDFCTLQKRWQLRKSSLELLAVRTVRGVRLEKCPLVVLEKLPEVVLVHIFNSRNVLPDVELYGER